MLIEPLASGVVYIQGKKSGKECLLVQPCPEHMILVNAVRYLAVPDPSAAEFVPVTTLVEKHIAGQQP